jgi:hypothetical protein
MSEYQTVYGVGLLDDIHNYFPALLYNQGRFNSVQEIFHYVRSQLNTRFNLFAYGASLAQAQQPVVQPVAQPVPRRTVAQEDSAIASLLITMLTGVNNPASASSLPIFRVPAGFSSPVVIAPSINQINQNSQIVTGRTGSCAICQDFILLTDSCRILNSCQHVYHRGCIDTWFERSVYCPSCRHDVRDSTSVDASGTPLTQTTDSSGNPLTQ